MPADLAAGGEAAQGGAGWPEQLNQVKRLGRVQSRNGPSHQRQL